MKSNVTRNYTGPITTSGIILPCFNRFFPGFLLGFIFFIISSTHVFATTKTFTTTGSFSDPTKWTGGTLPVAGDNLDIDGICTIDNNVLTDNVVYGTLTIGKSISGTINWVVGGTNRLNIGNLNSNISGSVLDMTNGGTLIKTTGTWNSVNMSFIAGAGTIELRSTLNLPAAYSTYYNLTINGAAIAVSLGANTIIYGSLVTTNGTFDPGANSLTVIGSTVVTNTFTISSAGATSFAGLTINGTFNNTANSPITISGDFQNNGTYNGGTGIVTFTGAGSNIISGSAAFTAFDGGIIVNKGASSASVLDVQSVITMPAGGLTLTNGTFKLSSASAITPFTADITTAPYLIPSTAGLWVNGGTVSSTSPVTAAGLIRVSNGTFNIGDAANESLMSCWSTIIIDGGALNVAGRLMGRISTEGSDFTMTGGTLTVPTVGSTSATISPFQLDNGGSSFSMSGGTIVIERSGGSNLGYLNTPGTFNVIGGTLQIGDGSTPAGQTILINTSAPVGNFILNGSNSPSAQLSTNSLTVRTDITLTSGTLNANNLDIMLGGNWSRDNAAGFTQGTGTVIFNGGGSQFIYGTAPSQIFNNLTVSKLAGSTLNTGGSTTAVTINNFTETTGNFASPATMNISGNWTNNGGTFIPGTNTVTFNGTGAQSINGTAATQSFYNMVLALTAGQTLSVAGSTTTLTVQDFTETTGNFTAGTAALVSIAGNLTITAGTYTSGLNTDLTGNFSNTGTYTSVSGNTITFTGIDPTAITGAGTYTIFNVAMNKTTKTTLVDVQSFKFITGINTGNVYNFTFTQGTWKYNNTATLTDCHNNGVTAALTIPFNVVIECPTGLMNLCKSGTSGNVILSGKLFVNGGIVKVMESQVLNSGMDFKYKVNGGTPQLYISNGGDLLVGAGFNASAATDYIEFNMSGAASVFHVADVGYSVSYTFQLNNVVGGSTVMTGGTIVLENASNIALPDIDMGGGNVSPYSVTGGTVQFGFTGTQGGSTFFGIKYYTATNYPNIDFQSGIAKTVSPYTSDGQTLNALSIFINPSMTLDMTTANPDPNVVFLTNNGTFALSISGTILMGTGGVVFKGNAVNQLITGTGASYTFNNMTVNTTAGNAVTVGGAITALNVANYTQTQGDYTPPADFNVSGNWTHDAGAFIPGTNTVTFNGTGTQTINGTTAAKTFYNVVVSKTAGTLTTGGSTTTMTTQDLTETLGNFTAPATLNINGNFLLTAGTFIPATTTNIKGNWTNNGGTFTPGTKMVNFIGTGTKTIGGTIAASFYNLTINTVAATDIVQLTNTTTATSILALTKGVFDLNSNLLSVTSGLAGAITRTSGYILSEKTDNSSKVKWNIGATLTSHIYPFGTISGLYIPFTLNLTAGNVGNVTVSTYPTAFLNTPYPVTPILVTNMYTSTGSDNSPNVVDRFWQIDKENESGTATLTFVATPAEVGTITGLTAQRYETLVDKWQVPLTGQTSTATSATVAGVTKFSPWALSGNGSMLPIELLNFTAALNKTQVDLNWVTASELNNDFFTVEKTMDLENYEAVAVIDGAGSSTHSLSYSTPDINPFSGISYYRLKQTDFNGTETYSNIVSVNMDISAEQFLAYPNPMTGTSMNVILPGVPVNEIRVIIYNMNGQEVFSTRIDANADGSFTVTPSEKLSTGMYLLTLISDAGSYEKKLMVQ